MQPSLRTQVEHIVQTGCKPTTPSNRYKVFLEALSSSELLKEREHQILIEALKRARQYYNIYSTNALFYTLIEPQYKNLSHGELLVLCLSIIYSKRQKAANRLFAQYKSILHTPQNKRSIEKISSCLNFIAAIERSHSIIHSVVYEGNTLKVELQCNDMSKFPGYLFEESKKYLILSLGIQVAHKLLVKSNDIKVEVEDKASFE